MDLSLVEKQDEFGEFVVMPKIYSTEDLRKMFGLKSKTTIVRWIRSGKMKALKVGRDYRVTESALEVFLSKQGHELKEFIDSQMSLFGQEEDD